MWYVYLLECKDKSIYTGITTNVERRLKEHNHDNLKGAKSLRRKRPVKLMYFEEHDNQSEARKREATIKKGTREYKLKLIRKNQYGLP